MKTAVAAHGLDLITFLYLAPLVIGYGVEKFSIAAVYMAGGVLLCLAFKAAGLSLAFGFATKAPRYQRLILIAAALAGVVGAASNTFAMYQLRSAL